jgi:hypothetical protein
MGVTTTLANLDDGMSTSGIPWEILPQPFRAAVALTENVRARLRLASNLEWDGVWAGAEILWGVTKSAERVDELITLLDAEYFGLQIAARFIMVIRPVAGAGPGVFERVGSVQRNWNGEVPDLTRWFDGAEVKTVTLL